MDRPEAKLFQILIDQGLFNLMTQNGTLKDDIKVPTGSLGSNISSDFNEGKDLRMPYLSQLQT
jgi:translation initiation factor 5A